MLCYPKYNGYLSTRTLIQLILIITKNMNKYIAIITVFAFTLFVGGAIVRADDVSLTPPPVGGGDTSATPPIGGSSSSAAPAAPTVGSVVTSAGPVVSPTPTPPVTASGGSRVSGGSYAGSYVGGGSFSAGLVASSSPCKTITSFLKSGANNDVAQVSILQTYLKNKEGLDVDVNGSYDSKTVEAVKAFQNKFSDVILAPWGATKASGQVYITTLKKINQLLCKTTMTLSPDELNTINSYKNSAVSVAIPSASATQSVGDNSAPAQVGPTVGAAPSPSATATDNAVGTNQDSASSNVAAAGSSSVFGRFADFIKGLFR